MRESNIRILNNHYNESNRLTILGYPDESMMKTEIPLVKCINHWILKTNYPPKKGVQVYNHIRFPHAYTFCSVFTSVVEFPSPMATRSASVGGASATSVARTTSVVGAGGTSTVSGHARTTILPAGRGSICGISFSIALSRQAETAVVMARQIMRTSIGAWNQVSIRQVSPGL